MARCTMSLPVTVAESDKDMVWAEADTANARHIVVMRVRIYFILLLVSGNLVNLYVSKLLKNQVSSNPFLYLLGFAKKCTFFMVMLRLLINRDILKVFPTEGNRPL